MGIFSTTNKDNERNVNFAAGNKIGNIDEGAAINATLKEDCLSIRSRINKSMVTTLKYEKITECQFLTDKEIQEKSKSVAGRAIIGGLILGPVGAIVGGLTGINNKRVTNRRNFIIINYKRDDDDVGVVSLEVVGASLKWDKFLSELREKINKEPQLEIEL